MSIRSAVFFAGFFVLSGNLLGCGKDAPEPAATRLPAVTLQQPGVRDIVDNAEFTG